MKDQIVAKHYQLSEKLGGGAFGEVWKAINLESKEEVAVKFEEISDKHQALYSEMKMYCWLQCQPDASLQPLLKVYHFDSEGGKNILVFDLLGPSIDQLFNKCGKKFSLKTVLLIGLQLIDRLEYVHSKGLIHRDMKPENFAIGIGSQAHQIYLLDFGLGRKYIQANGKHVKYRDGRPITGTMKFMSVNVHSGIEPSRRDDMESLGYILLYLFDRNLPWNNVQAKDTNLKNEAIKQLKEGKETDVYLSRMPRGFADYLGHCRSLSFADKPNYDGLKAIVRSMMAGHDIAEDNDFDWLHV